MEFYLTMNRLEEVLICWQSGEGALKIKRISCNIELEILTHIEIGAFL